MLFFNAHLASFVLLARYCHVSNPVAYGHFWMWLKTKLCIRDGVMACVYGCVYMCVFLSFRFQRGELLIVLILWYVNVPYWVEPSEEGHQRSDSENYVKMIFPDRKLGILFILSMYISRKNTIISRSFAVIKGRILTTLFITTCGFFSTQVTNNNNGVYLLSSFYVLASKWIASPKIFCCTLCCFFVQ